MRMQTVLIFILVSVLLAADALIFFVLGVAYAQGRTIKDLRAQGWTVEPPETVPDDD